MIITKKNFSKFQLNKFCVFKCFSINFDMIIIPSKKNFIHWGNYPTFKVPNIFENLIWVWGSIVCSHFWAYASSYSIFLVDNKNIRIRKTSRHLFFLFNFSFLIFRIFFSIYLGFNPVIIHIGSVSTNFLFFVKGKELI